MRLVDKFIKELGGNNIAPPLNNFSLFILGSGYNTKKYYGKVYKSQPAYSFLNISKNGNSQGFFPADVWPTYASEVFRNYLKNPKSIKAVWKNFHKNYSKIDKIYSKYTHKFIAKTSEKELLPKVAMIYDLIWETNAWSHFSILFDQDICFKVVSDIYPNVTRDNISSIWDRAVIMNEDSFDVKQKRELLELVIKSTKPDELTEYCQYFYSNYRSIPSLESTKSTLKGNYSSYLADKKLAKKALKQMDLELKNRKKSYLEWRKKLNPLQKKIAEYCQFVMSVRDERKSHIAKGTTAIWRIAEKSFGLAGLDASLIENVLPFKELVKGSAYLKGIAGELKKRTEGYVIYVPYSGEIEVGYDDIEETHKIINDLFVQLNVQSSSEVKGQIGNKGIYVGVVKIVMGTGQFHEFKEGEVLITGMTRPEYVPLMKKAGAIVTDEGGITCHAAIVSRELNKPCIIGTKIASKVFKDGDLVEVDADNGIVRVIDKK